MSPPPEVTLQLRRVVDDVRGMVESAAWHASNLKCYKTRTRLRIGSVVKGGPDGVPRQLPCV